MLVGWGGGLEGEWGMGEEGGRGGGDDCFFFGRSAADVDAVVVVVVGDGGGGGDEGGGVGEVGFRKLMVVFGGGKGCQAALDSGGG